MRGRSALLGIRLRRLLGKALQAKAPGVPAQAPVPRGLEPGLGGTVLRGQRLPRRPREVPAARHSWRREGDNLAGDIVLLAGFAGHPIADVPTCSPDVLGGGGGSGGGGASGVWDGGSSGGSDGGGSCD